MPYASIGDYAEIEEIINEGIERTARFEARIEELEKELKETKESLWQLQIKRRDTMQAEEDRYQIARVEEQYLIDEKQQRVLKDFHDFIDAKENPLKAMLYDIARAAKVKKGLL